MIHYISPSQTHQSRRKRVTHRLESRMREIRQSGSEGGLFPAMLGLIVLGLLMGARDVLDFWRKVARLTQNQRPALGLCVGDKQIRRITMPGYNALNALPQAHASRPASLLKRPQPGL